VNYYQLVNAVQDYTENTFAAVDINTFIEQAEQRIYNDVQFPSLRKNVIGTVNSGTPYLSAPNDYLSSYSLAIYTTAVTVASGTIGTNTITVPSNSGILVGMNVSGSGIGAGAIVANISGTTITLSVFNTANMTNAAVNFQGPYQYLLNKDVNFIRQAFPWPGVSGTPSHYALFGPTTANGVITNELSFIVGPTPDRTYNAELNYYYYPPSIIPGIITSLNGSWSVGVSYVAGTYYNQPLTGGTGSDATATIVVGSAGTITAVALVSGGSGYTTGDSLSIVLGSGNGFSITVTNVNQTTGTTWLGDNYDVAILYGTLVEAITFMKGEQDMVALYDGKYKEAIAQAKRLGDGLERQDAYRSGQYRQKVT